MSLGYTSLADMLCHTPGLDIKDTPSSGRLIIIKEDTATPNTLSQLSEEESDEKNYINQVTANSERLNIVIYFEYCITDECFM